MLGTDVSFHIGMFQWIQLITPFIKAGLNVEVNGVKLVPSLRLLYDITTYADFCSSIDITTSGFEIVVTGSLDVYDCNLGMLGSIYQLLTLNNAEVPDLGRARDCEPRQYWFEKKPIFRLGLDNIVKDWWNFTILPEMCLFNKGEAWEQ